MINPQELRLGNWINNFGEIVQIGEIRLEDNEFQPIPLTPEILEAAGFVFYDNLYSNGNLEFATLKKDGSEMYLVPNSIYCLELKYLHQLQNLIFALTGEELTIKL